LAVITQGNQRQAQVPAQTLSQQLPQSVLGQLQLASLTQQQQSLAGLSNRGLINQAQASSVPSSLEVSLISRLAAAQNTNQASSIAQASQQGLAPAHTNLLQQLLASPNQTSVPTTASSQNQTQVIQKLVEENQAKNQIIALLASQVSQLEQALAQTGPSVQQNNGASSQPTQLELLLRNMGTASATPSNSGSVSNQSAASVSELVSSLGLGQQQQAQATNGVASAVAAAPAVQQASSPISSASAQGDSDAESEEGHVKRWMVRYEELKQFRQEYGHCRVPHGYAENRKLSWWVMNQRAQYNQLKSGKKSWLSGERVQMLNDIGFDWNLLVGKSRRKSQKKNKKEKST
jgi:hypothetical protein